MGRVPASAPPSHPQVPTPHTSSNCPSGLNLPLCHQDCQTLTAPRFFSAQEPETTGVKHLRPVNTPPPGTKAFLIAGFPQHSPQEATAAKPYWSPNTPSDMSQQWPAVGFAVCDHSVYLPSLLEPC